MPKLEISFACALCALFSGACIEVEDPRTHAPPDLPPALHPNALRTQSWDVCRLLGPKTAEEGIYGTDLGYTVAVPGSDQLAVLFGDTWSESGDACQYPVEKSDDLQAFLPLQRPDVLTPGAPTREANENACSTLEHTLDDPEDPKSWRRIRLYASEQDRDESIRLDTAALRTPVAAYSDGATVFGMFTRGDVASCEHSSECPRGMLCSNDVEQEAVALGQCPQPFALSEDPIPQLCRGDDDCPPAVTCDFGTPAVCYSPRAFRVDRDGIRIDPDWYRDDPRLGAAQVMYIAAARFSDRPEDYVVEHRFVTRRFVNVAVRTVAHFDPEDAASNDYRSGDETLLMWGRPSFATTHGVQSLPFLLYVPLDELRAEEPLWRPRFFAGYDESGKPAWSDFEDDAQPIYGAEASIERDTDGDDAIEWREPEFDYVNQMSVSYIEPLQRFVMIYGGDVPAWLVMDPDGTVPEPVNVQPSPGAMHQRTARHPWGRATLDAEAGDAWSSPEPVLTRLQAAPYLACGNSDHPLPGCTDEGDANTPFDLLATIASVAADDPSETLDVTGDCLEGSATLAAQNAASGDPMGRMYGANIIDEWTQDVTEGADDLEDGERAVEIYWNVSMWNPYQVLLMKTRVRGAR